MSNQVNAKTIRATLKAAGLEQLVSRVRTGKRNCLIDLQYGTPVAQIETVIAALRPLWDDGEQRVRHFYGNVVSVSRSGYWHTVPAGQLPQRPDLTDLQRTYLLWLGRGKIADLYPMTVGHHQVAELYQRKLVYGGFDGVDLTEQGRALYAELAPQR